MIYLRVFCVCLLLFITSSCINIAGGVIDIDGRAARCLDAHNTSKALIRKVLSLDKLSEKDFQRFSESGSQYVRYYIAKNPNLPKNIMNKLANDWYWLVRSGVAENPSITIDVINLLKKDSRRSVRNDLVRNPIVPDSVLIELYKNHMVSLPDCVANPNCPEVIKKDLQKEDKDSTAWDYFNYAEERKKYKKYIKDKNGRWIYNPEKMHKKVNLEELLKEDP